MADTPSLKSAAVAVARAHRTKGANHPDTRKARGELLIAHVTRLVEAAPPLSPEQIARVSAVLKSRS